MSAIIDGIGLAGTADDGDVPSESIGIGFSNDELELAAADEELSDLEAIAGAMSANGSGPAGEPAVADGLPDEGEAPATTSDATATDADDGDVDADEGDVGADNGDVGADTLGLGFTDDQLRQAEDDDELAAVEGTDGAAAAMPDEVETGTTGAGELVDQPTKAPSRKVKAAGLGGVLGAIPAPILSLLDLLPVSDAVLGAISAALTLLGSLAAAYLARERAADPASANTG
jgi:hypothetical protein